MEINRRGPAGAPAIVLLHGIGSRWQVFEPILDRLAATHDVIAVDLPGFGLSPAEPGLDASPDGYATRVERLIAELGLGRPHVVGNSMGGGIALELGRRGVASQVTAFSPIGFWTLAERRWSQSIITGMRAFATVARPLLGPVIRSRVGRVALFSLFFAKPAQLTPAAAELAVDGLIQAAAFGRARAGFNGYDLCEHPRPAGGLAQIPVTIAWGIRDAILPARLQSAAARRLLPGARHVPLAGCGHLPFSDDPGMCAATVLLGR